MTAQTTPEPPLVLLGHPDGPEVVVVEATAPPSLPAATPRPRHAVRFLSWGASVALMVATIIGGLHLGYSLKDWVPHARDVAQSSADAPPLDVLARSAPPRRGDEWMPEVARTTDDRAPRTTRRATTPKASLPSAPEEASPWVRLTALMGEGIRLHRDGWYGPAMARFREAVSVMPDYLRAYLWLGRSGLKAGRYGEARRALERVIALDPQSPAAQEARTLLSQIDKDN